MLRIQLFGTGSVRYQDRALANFPRRQSCLLLCYLLLNRHTIFTRTRLASLFWADYSTTAARKYLRNTFWRLRRELEELGVAPDAYLLSDEQGIGFNPTAAYELDLEIFERTVHQFLDLPAEALADDQVKELEVAVALYVDDLLAGLYEDWCLEVREQFRQLDLSALTKLISYYERQSAFERALAYAEQILARDNVQERIHQRVMILHWRMGNRDAALAQYRACAQILQDELEAPPLEQTQQLYQQIAAGLAPPPVRPTGPGILEPASPALAHHLYQRLARLRSMLDEVYSEIQAIEALLDQLKKKP
jgi:DNA-binding SARP family transcriptional activator